MTSHNRRVNAQLHGNYGTLTITPVDTTTTTTGGTYITAPTITFTPDTDCGTYWTSESFTRSEVGGHDKCEECPYVMECMTGMLAKTFRLATQKQEHIDGVSPFCIEDGKLKLVPIDPAYTYSTSGTVTWR